MHRVLWGLGVLALLAAVFLLAFEGPWSAANRAQAPAEREETAREPQLEAAENADGLAADAAIEQDVPMARNKLVVEQDAVPLELKLRWTAEDLETTNSLVGLHYEVGVGYGQAFSVEHTLRKPTSLLTAYSATGTLDTHHLEVPSRAFDPHASRPMIIWARVLTPGYQQQRQATVWTQRGSAVVLQVMPKRGATLRGRVFDAQGRPIQGHGVELLAPDSDDGEAGWKGLSSATTEADGSFELHFATSGKYAIKARYAGVGVGSLRPLAMDIAHPPQDLELRLLEGGAIGGRVLDPSGQALTQFELWLTPADGASKRLGQYRRHRTQRRLQHEWQGGLHDEYATTNHLGEFRVAGLARNRYHVLGCSQVSGPFDQILTTVPIELGEERLELVVNQYRLIVTVVDELGHFPAVNAEHDPGIGGRWGPQSQERIALSLNEVVEEDQWEPQLRVTRLKSWVDERARVIFEVEPGKRYRLAAISPDRAPVETELEIVAGHHQKEVELRIPAREATGVLHAIAVQPNGEPTRRRIGFEVRNESTDTLLWEASRMSHTGSEWTVPLPQGRYRLLVYDMPRTSHHGDRFEDPIYAGAEQEIRIVGGETSTVHIRLGAGARLRLHVKADSEPDLNAWPARAETGRQPHNEGMRQSMGGALVQLTGIKTGIRFYPRFEVLTHPVQRVHVWDRWIPLNQPSDSYEPIPTGDYRVRISAPGFPPLEQSLHVPAEGLAELTVILNGGT